jgi:pyruvate kinase
MMLAGMDVARFNFSHGDYEEHRRRFESVMKIREELNIPIATMLDTKGPEIRLGKFRDNKPVEIFAGDKFVLTTRDIIGNEKGLRIV